MTANLIAFLYTLGRLKTNKFLENYNAGPKILHLYNVLVNVQYKMIAKMLWPLTQVNLPLKFYINEAQISLKTLWFFFTVTLWSFIKHHSPTSPNPLVFHHEKRWDASTPYAWRNYWTVPKSKMSKFDCEGLTTSK